MDARLIPFAGGWEAHRHRHCIWIVSPENYGHERAFDEVADALSEAFSELGGSAPVTRHTSEWNGRVPIVLGGNLLKYAGIFELPEGSIIYNMEQIVSGIPWLNEIYLAALHRLPVLDYSAQNRDEMRRLLGIEHSGLLEIGYSPTLSRISCNREKDIDVLFYGSDNERRVEVLKTVASQGLKVAYHRGVYGAARDEHIARAKIVLNVHYYEQSVFEVVRVSYLLANKVCVVSEGSPDDPDVAWAVGGLEFAPPDILAARCVALVEDDARREQLAETGFQRITSRRQSALLQRCIEAGLS